MINDHELRLRLAAYLAGDLSLASLERWLHSANQQPIVDSDDKAFRLLAAVNLLVSERHDEIIAAEQFRDELSALINTVVMSQAIEVTPEQQLYFAYLKMMNLVPETDRASRLVAV